MTYSYNNRVDRLANLLGSLALNLAEDGRAAMEEATGLAGSGTTALLALDEFLDRTHVGRLAEVLGLTHSGAVRLVTLLERQGLAERTAGADRRRVEVALTAAGRRRAATARAARDDVVRRTLTSLDPAETRALEELLDQLVSAGVAARVERRASGDAGGAWWCRGCDFEACGRPEGRCPAQVTAARPRSL